MTQPFTAVVHTGQARAVEVVSKQNASLLQLLEVQEVETHTQNGSRHRVRLHMSCLQAKTAVEENKKLCIEKEHAELKQQHRSHLETSAQTEAEMLTEKAKAQMMVEKLAKLHEQAERDMAVSVNGADYRKLCC